MVAAGSDVGSEISGGTPSNQCDSPKFTHNTHVPSPGKSGSRRVAVEAVTLDTARWRARRRVEGLVPG
jgi:hypothetical protein